MWYRTHVRAFVVPATSGLESNCDTGFQCKQKIIWLWDSQDTVEYLTLQRTATYCDVLQHTATYSNALQDTATHCNTLQHTTTHSNTLQLDSGTHKIPWSSTTVGLQHTQLQRTATHCNVLQRTATQKQSRTIYLNLGPSLDRERDESELIT